MNMPHHHMAVPNSGAGVKKLKKSLEAAGRRAICHVYPGTTHWFFESDRPDAFNKAAADLSWRRTLAFLRQGLTVCPPLRQVPAG